jgi:hypothetical protein
VAPWTGKKILAVFSYAFGTHSESVGACALLVGCVSLLTRPSLLVLLLDAAGSLLTTFSSQGAKAFLYELP